MKTTLDAAQTVQYTALISGITKQVRASDSTIDVFIALYFLCVPSCQARAMVRNIDPGNDLTFLRLRCRLFSNLASEHCLKCFVSRSKKNEILIAPGWCCEIVSVGVGNISADRDYILIVVQLAADHLLNTAEQAREG